MKKWLFNVFIGLDQFANTLILGAPDETISSRCGRGYGKKWYWTKLGNCLNWLQPNHIQMAVESERERLHEPEELRP